MNGKEKEKGGGKECSDGGEGAKLYQNAGVLESRGDKTPCSECKQAEKYFPLDIAVLGDQSNVRNLSNSYLNLIQELEVKDNITQVIGVRLDQVVISETGIGDGKGSDINWGTVTVPTLKRELLK